MDWIANHWETLGIVAAGIISVASAIANLTPNESDNKIIAKISKLANVLGLNLNVKSLK